MGPPKLRKKCCTQSLSEKNEGFYYVFSLLFEKKHRGNEAHRQKIQIRVDRSPHFVLIFNIRNSGSTHHRFFITLNPFHAIQLTKQYRWVLPKMLGVIHYNIKFRVQGQLSKHCLLKCLGSCPQYGFPILSWEIDWTRSFSVDHWQNSRICYFDKTRAKTHWQDSRILCLWQNSRVWYFDKTRA